MATRLDAHQSSTRNQISLTDTDMGRLLHPSGRHGNIVWTLSLIRQEVEKNCNRTDVVLIMVITCSRSATVRTLEQRRLDAV